MDLAYSKSRCLKLIRYSLQSIGCFPIKNQSVYYKAFTWFNFIIYATKIGGEILYLFHSLGDLMEFIEQLATVICGSLMLLRIMSYLVQYDDYKSMIEYFVDNIWFDNDGKHKKTDPEKNKIIEDYTKLSDFLTTLYFMSTSSTVLAFCLMPVTAPLVFESSAARNRSLPFKLYLPYIEVGETPNYQILYFMESWLGYLVFVILAGHDTLFFVCTNYTVGQFKILHLELRNLSKSSLANAKGRNFSSREDRMEFLQYENLRLLNRSIEKHNMLSRFCVRMDDCFGPVMFINIVVASMTLCITSFQVTVPGNSEENNIKFTFYFVSQLFQMTMLCWHGNNIIDSSEEVAEAMYDMEWYQEDKRKCVSNVGIVMMRAQRPELIKAGKMIDVSFLTLSAILQTSMSYFTLLQTMNE